MMCVSFTGLNFTYRFTEFWLLSSASFPVPVAPENPEPNTPAEAEYPRLLSPLYGSCRVVDYSTCSPPISSSLRLVNRLAASPIHYGSGGQDCRARRRR